MTDDDDFNFKDWKVRLKTAALQDPMLRYPLTRLVGILLDYTREENGRGCFPSRELLALRMTIEGEMKVALSTITGWTDELEALGWCEKRARYINGKTRTYFELADIEHVMRVERRIEKSKDRIRVQLAQESADRQREILIETDTGFENVG